RLPVSSTKSMTGHLLTAASAIEAVLTVLVLQDGILPPNLNFETPDPDCPLALVTTGPGGSRDRGSPGPGHHPRPAGPDCDRHVQRFRLRRPELQPNPATRLMSLDSLFEFADHHFLHSPESRAKVARHLSRRTVNSLQKSKFRRLVRYLGQNSRFYQRKFREYGIDPRAVRSHADLGNFFTTAQDLRDNPVEDFLCARPEFGFENTGTSMGVNKRVYFSYREMSEYGRDGAVGMYNLGLRPDDVVADGFDYSFWN